MGNSNNGQICYGYLFPNDYVFPWDLSRDGGDVNDWWMIETGWKYDGECPYTLEGEYRPGFSYEDPRTQAYLDSYNDWLRSHPFPFELVNYQTSDYPAYIIAIKSTFLQSFGGVAIQIIQNMLDFPSQEEFESIAKFIEKYSLEPESGPAWYLSSSCLG